MSFDLCVINWEAIGALATVAATIVALYLGLRGRKVKIELDVEHQGTPAQLKIIARNLGNLAVSIEKLYMRRANADEPKLMLIFPAGESITVMPDMAKEISYELPLKNISEFDRVESLYCIDTRGRKWEADAKKVQAIVDKLKTENL